MKQKIGWIGTGVMGFSMCSHLIEAGHEAFVYNRTKSKTDGLEKMGATVCDSPGQVAEKKRCGVHHRGLPL